MKWRAAIDMARQAIANKNGKNPDGSAVISNREASGLVMLLRAWANFAASKHVTVPGTDWYVFAKPALGWNVRGDRFVMTPTWQKQPYAHAGGLQGAFGRLGDALDAAGIEFKNLQSPTGTDATYKSMAQLAYQRMQREDPLSADPGGRPAGKVRTPPAPPVVEVQPPPVTVDTPAGPAAVLPPTVLVDSPPGPVLPVEHQPGPPVVEPPRPPPAPEQPAQTFVPIQPMNDAARAAREAELWEHFQDEQAVRAQQAADAARERAAQVLADREAADRAAKQAIDEHRAAQDAADSHAAAVSRPPAPDPWATPDAPPPSEPTAAPKPKPSPSSGGEVVAAIVIAAVLFSDN